MQTPQPTDTPVKKPLRILQAQDDVVVVEIQEIQIRRGIIGSNKAMPCWEGVVVATGTGTKCANGEYNQIHCKPGDTVLFSPVGATEHRDGDRLIVFLDRSQVYTTIRPHEDDE